MIFKVLSNLNHSMILWFYDIGDVVGALWLMLEAGAVKPTATTAFSSPHQEWITGLLTPMGIHETSWQRVSLVPLQIQLPLRKMAHYYQFPSAEAAESCTMEFKFLTLPMIHARANIILYNKTGFFSVD